MSGKKLISIIIGILFTQSLLSQSNEYLFIEETSNSRYFVSVRVYRRDTSGDEIQTTFTHNGRSYPTGVDRQYHRIMFYAESLEGGFSFTAWGQDVSGSYWTETVSISKKELQEGIYGKSGVRFSVTNIEIVRKAEIEGFYPSIICSTSNKEDDLSITLRSDSDESIGVVRGVIRIDDFQQGTGLVNTIISAADFTKDGKVSIGESHSVSFTNSYFDISSTSSLPGFYLLEPPPISIEFRQPQCHGESGTIRISNIPESPTSTSIRLNIIQLYEDPSSDLLGGDSFEVVHNTRKLYYGAGSTQLIDIPQGSTSYTFTPESIDEALTGLTLRSGWYMAKAFYYDGSSSELCPFQAGPEEMGQPDPVVFSDISTVFSEGGYHIPKKGGQARIQRLETTGNDGAVSLWDEQSNEEYVDYGSIGFDAGPYSFYVKDSNGCKSEELTFKFNEPTAISPTAGNIAIVVHNPECHADNTNDSNKTLGSIVIPAISGGIPEYTYELIDNSGIKETKTSTFVQTSQTTIQSISPGNYTLKIRDKGHEFYSNENVSIEAPLKMTLAPNNISPSCDSEGNGTVALSVANGTSPYTYYKGTTDLNGNVADDLKADTYSFMVKDDNGCEATLSNVSVTNSPLGITKHAGEVDVCGQQNGTVKFSITGGKPADYPYYVTLTPSGGGGSIDSKTIESGGALTNLEFENVPEGTYTLSVSSRNNCLATDKTFTVAYNNPLKPGKFTTTPASCYAVADGSGVFTVTGLGTESISSVSPGYSFTQNADKITVNGLKSTSQTITLTDTRGCTVDFKKIIGGVTPDSLYINATKSDLTCPMVEDGAIEARGIKGRNDKGYQYQLEKMVAGQFTVERPFGDYAPAVEEMKFPPLSEGIYRVSVRDMAGCLAKKELTISSGDNPVAWNGVTPVNASCDEASNGRIIINEGVRHHYSKPLAYYKNTEAYEGNPAGLEAYFGSLPPDSYSVMIADEDGCYVEEEVSVGSLDYAPTLLFETITAVACDGKSTGQIEVNIEDNSLASPDYSIDLGWMSDGGFVKQESYLGDEPSTTFQNLTNKEYTIEVIDGNNCSNTFTYTPELHSPALTLTENWIDASCFNVDGAIEMSATGGISEGAYDFYFGSDTILGISDTIIFKPVGEVGQVKVVDDADCVVSGEENRAVRVRETAVEISEVATIHPSCIGDDDGRIEFLLRGDSELEYSYILTKRENPLEVYRGLINPGEVTIPDLPVGIYDLIVVEAPLNAYSTTEEISQWCSNPYPGIEVTDWKSIEVEDFSYNYIDYFGEATGSMEVTISGGSLVYDYEIVREVDNTVIESGEIREGYFTNNVSLLAGNYIFRFRDVNQCMYFVTGEWYEQPFTIEQPDEALFLPVQVLNNLSCFNSGNGRIEVAAQGGWGADYTYKLEGPVSGEWQSDGVFENLTKGTYSVLVRDSRAVEHQFTDAFTLTQPDPFSLNVTRTKDATCPGYNNGEVDVVSTNGVYQGEGLKYQIYTKGGEEVVVSYSGGEWKYNKLVQGSYTVEVTDANGCVADDAFAIGEPEQIEITSNQNYIRAKFDNTGEVSFEVSKGNGYYEYSWALEGAESPLESGTTEGALSFEDLPAGDYIFMLRDTARCRYEGDSEWMVRPIRMEEPEFELNFDVLIDSVTCNGLDDGKLSFNGIGGWGDYEFSFEGGDYSAQDSVEMLAPGVYNLAVRDAAGIIYERPIEVFEPEILSVSEGAQLSDVSCFGGSDGSISVDITGGNLAYFVSSDGENWFEGNVVKHLPIGQFDVFVKDAKGCETSTGSFTLNQPSEIVRDPGFSVKESTCQKDEGAIYADFSGGTGALSYTWLMERVQSDGSFETEILTEYATSSIEGLYAGHYMVDVMDEHGCIVQFPFDVNDNTDLSILSIDTYPVSCYGYSDGAAKAEISFGNPPYRYAWRGDGLATLGDSAWNYNAGEHRLSVWDEKGCYVFEAFEVGTPDSLFYQITEQIQPLCLGGAKGRISLAGTGGTAPYQYEWNDGTKTAVLEGVDPGDYQLVMTDSHACVSSFDFDFNYQRTVEPFIGNDTLICHYNTLKLDAGDYSIFEWHATTDFTSSNRFVEVNQSASYFLKVADGDNCIGFDTLSLDVSVLEISDISTEDIRCAGLANGEATVTINSNSDNYTIEWPDGGSGTSSSGYAGGEYTVLVQNEYGCSDTLDYTLFEPDPLTITTSFNEPLCLGVPDGYVRPVVSGGIGNYRYQWNQGETKREISRLSEGNYVFTVTDDNDCWLTDEYYLAYKRTLLPDLGGDKVVCQGNSVSLNPGSFHNLSWYHDEEFASTDSVFDAHLPGSYVVVVNDEDNCIGRDSVHVDVLGAALLPSFLMATSVPLGDTLLVVEVTQPKPKFIDWEIGGSHRIVERGEFFAKVIFDEEGIFPVTLSSYADEGCMGQERKSILVTSASPQNEQGENVYQQQNLISLEVSPNPSQGEFNALVKMHEVAPVTFYLVRIDTGQIYETRKRQGLSVYNESFTHSGVGQFVLFVESGGERLMEKIIVL